MAARVTLNRTITVCSIYLPPSQTIHLRELNELYDQLPAPAVILGDFNAHNILWGGNRTDPKGAMIENFLSRNNLCLWNDDSSTYLNSGTGSVSSIDLSICHPTLLLDYEWYTEADPCGSDHFPIILSGDYNIPERIPAWNLSRANWPLFTSLCDEKMSEIQLTFSLRSYMTLHLSLYLKQAQIQESAINHGSMMNAVKHELSVNMHSKTSPNNHLDNISQSTRF